MASGLAEKLGFDTRKSALGAKIKLEATGLSPDREQSFKFQRKEFEITVAGVYEAPSMGPRFVGEGLLLPVNLMKEIPGIAFTPALQNLKAGRSAQGSGYAKAIGASDGDLKILFLTEAACVGFFG